MEFFSGALRLFDHSFKAIMSIPLFSVLACGMLFFAVFGLAFQVKREAEGRREVK